MRAWCDEDFLWVELTDGRRIGAPLVYFPRLLHAGNADRCNVQIVGDGTGLHWPALDEDVSVERLVFGPSEERILEIVRP
jgi:hypothetical protein